MMRDHRVLKPEATGRSRGSRARHVLSLGRNEPHPLPIAKPYGRASPRVPRASGQPNACPSWMRAMRLVASAHEG